VSRDPPRLGRTHECSCKQALHVDANHAGDDAEFTGELALDTTTGKIPELTQASQDGLLPDQRSNFAYRIDTSTTRTAGTGLIPTNLG
jgi:hypothetical protein